MRSVLLLTYAQHLFSAGKLFIFLTDFTTLYLQNLLLLHALILFGGSFRNYFFFAFFNKGILPFLKEPFCGLCLSVCYLKLYELKSSFWKIICWNFVTVKCIGNEEGYPPPSLSGPNKWCQTRTRRFNLFYYLAEHNCWMYGMFRWWGRASTPPPSPFSLVGTLFGYDWQKILVGCVGGGERPLPPHPKNVEYCSSLRLAAVHMHPSHVV